MGRSDPVTEAHHLPGADARVMITAAEARPPGAGSPNPHTRVLLVLTLSKVANGSFCPIPPLSITSELLKLVLS